MFGFYIIRKLIEANKLTNKIVSTKRNCLVFKNTGTKLTILNNHRFHEYFDFQNSVNKKFDLKFLNNQFVHSYIFSPIIGVVDKKSIKLLENDKLTEHEYIDVYEKGDKEVVSILFNSDKNKDESLFQIDVKDLIQLFEDVGNCNVTKSIMKFNPKKNDWDVTQTDEIIPIDPELEETITKLEKK